GKLRHPVYLGLRDDKKATDVTRETARKVRGSAVNAQRGSSDLIDQLRAIEASRRDGVLALPDGQRLSVSNLHKVFWPKQKLTKGDLLRYYVQVAPFILPAVADRPLVMKRLPNGIAGHAFYQQRAPDQAPPGVRVEKVAADTSVATRPGRPASSAAISRRCST